MPEHAFPKRPRLEKSFYTDPECVFHIVVRAFVENAPFAGRQGELVWAALLEERTRDDVGLVAACLMPDHLHIVVRPGRSSIPMWVRLFKSYQSKALRSSGYTRSVWQPGYWDRLVRSELEYGTLLQYVRRNPVEAGLVAVADDWPWLLMPET